MMGTNLSEQSLWLLRFLVERLPGGYAVLTALPSDAPTGLSMMTIRGLEKRGYAEEVTSGIFMATDEGVKALARASEGDKAMTCKHCGLRVGRWGRTSGTGPTYLKHHAGGSKKSCGRMLTDADIKREQSPAPTK